MQVFVSTQTRVNTVLLLHLRMDVVRGVFRPMYSMYSNAPMSKEAQAIYAVCLVFFILSALGLAVELMLTRRADRLWKNSFHEHFGTTGDGPTFLKTGCPKTDEHLRVDWERSRKFVQDSFPAMHAEWLMQAFARLLFLAYAITHGWWYINTDPDATLNQFEKEIAAIAKSTDENRTTQEVLRMFATLMDIYYRDYVLRVIGFLILCGMFTRILAFSADHPRLAIVWRTMTESLNDLMHFGLLFFLSFFGLAFGAVYSIGPFMPEFNSFGQACYTQLRMLVGDWGFYSYYKLQNTVPLAQWSVYEALFLLVIFFIMVNFLLAVILDCYSGVRQQIGDSIIERNAFVDYFALLCIRPFYKRRHQWPAAHHIVLRLYRVVPKDAVGPDAGCKFPLEVEFHLKRPICYFD